MSKYDRLIGEERKSREGYINPLDKEFTTHEEAKAHVEVLKELGEWNFPNPASRRVARETKEDFEIKATVAVTKRNNPTQ